MKKPDCLLLRVSGEVSLKSEYVRSRFFETLIKNVKKALNRENIKFRIEINPNRIFIYTDEIQRAEKILKNIFGLSSLSPAWVTFSGIDEIRLLACDLAVENFKLNENKSFALRVRVAGRHRKFSLRAIAEEVGAAIKRVTSAPVDLTNPDVEIFIECRSRRTYIFTEKVKAIGGLPLGTGGRVISLAYTPQDVVAGWLIMKRGCELIVITDSEEYANILEKWHIGGRIKIIYEKEENLGEVLKKLKKYPLVHGSTSMVIYSQKRLVLNPLICLTERETEKMFKKIKNF